MSSHKSLDSHCPPCFCNHPRSDTVPFKVLAIVAVGKMSGKKETEKGKSHRKVIASRGSGYTINVFSPSFCFIFRKKNTEFNLARLGLLFRLLMTAQEKSLWQFYDFWIVLIASTGPMRERDRFDWETCQSNRRTAAKKWQTWREKICQRKMYSSVIGCLQTQHKDEWGNKETEEELKREEGWKVPCRRQLKSADLRWGIQQGTFFRGFLPPWKNKNAFYLHDPLPFFGGRRRSPVSQSAHWTGEREKKISAEVMNQRPVKALSYTRSCIYPHTVHTMY